MDHSYDSTYVNLLKFFKIHYTYHLNLFVKVETLLKKVKNSVYTNVVWYYIV